MITESLLVQRARLQGPFSYEDAIALAAEYGSSPDDLATALDACVGRQELVFVMPGLFAAPVQYGPCAQCGSETATRHAEVITSDGDLCSQCAAKA